MFNFKKSFLSNARSMKFSALIGYLLLLLLSGSNAAVALEIGDQLCIQGFIMDYFCIQNVNMIDNGLVTLEEPDRHTVHCLVDVGICLDSAFEVLVESPNQASSTSAYTRGYRLDDGSKTDVISLARRVGSCSTCVNGYDNSMLNRGFKAVMKVTVLDLNPDDSQSAPPLIRVDERKDSSGLGNDPCQSEYGMMEGVPTGTSVNPPTTLPATNPPTPPPTMRPITPRPTNAPSRTPTNRPTAPPMNLLTLTPQETPLPTKVPTTPTLPTKAPTLPPPTTTTASDATPVPSPTMNPNSTSPRGEEKEEELADSGNGIHLFSVATIVAFSSLYASMIL